MPRLLVDGMNVIGTRPSGWWRDREGAARELLARVQRYARASGGEVTLVLEGRAARGVAEGVHEGVEVVHARGGGRNAGDERIVELVAGDADASTLVVVTSDRALRERVEALGARVEGASAFLARLDAS